MGQKQKVSATSPNAAGGNSSASGAESMGSGARADSRASRYSTGGIAGGAEDYEFDSDDEDWDHVEDLDAAARALGADGGSTTIKGKKKKRSPYLLGVTGGFNAARAGSPSASASPRPVTPKNQLTGSSTSLGPGPALGEPSPLDHSIRPRRSTRLSNVEEVADRNSADVGGALVPMTSTPQLRSPSRDGRPPSRGPGQSYARSGSVRSYAGFDQPLPDIKLAMTPENIKPLLENAREVHIRLNECIKEMRLLMEANAVPGEETQDQRRLPSPQ
ncbi:hypothetical protein CONPUDRAFT_139100 [Coniophora puteana RWD-64-598 SS2]|uniref:Uncharacterized protein n=1 Tax=Coniophora puteana (strain RWD-64-598) TaxID=741705 RepID=A0A5M3MGD5_CONPW|nr:uncharacterized protein CONPUDRAFT_139100 [Coniophora puteana RWD-64-598 SS2]EIW78056.1 hypothetical protein CONPUDRAFT_139100 [Coniophora puteana RWD-64-598 SS2]